MDPTPERFRRLARSAPHRWRSLLLVGTWSRSVHPLRIRVAQPDRVRIEHLDSTLILDGGRGAWAAAPC